MSEESALATVTLKVYDGTRLIATLPVWRTTSLGRREPSEPPPFARVKREGSDRIVIADLTETSISRKHLRAELQTDGSVRLVNESAKNSIALAGGGRLAPGQECVLKLPVTCELGSKVVQFETRVAEEPLLQSLRQPALVPGQSSTRAKLTRLRGLAESSLATDEAGLKEEVLLAWLQASMDVFQSAAASEDFLPKAVAAAAQMVDLDTVAVLLRPGGNWNIAAVCNRDGTPVPTQWRASQSMLRRVLQEQRTFFFAPPGAGGTQSLLGVQAVVAAPILDRAGAVTGALYGEGRSASGRGAVQPVSEIEAKLFELLAYGVASGLARVEQERQLIAERVKFEQFFTPELARMLQSRGEEMLVARDAEITVLFCDIKGFSRISGKSGAAASIEWVREVLSEMSDCVANCDGVLIDYGGDSLEAIWGAPLASDQHAAQACRAALQMQAALPLLNERWQSRLGERTDVSVGINTGPAQVGNIGSRRKFKYGAFGTTVNLASRVQGATKPFGVSTMITRATADRLGPQFHLRRLGSIRAVNIGQPAEILELAAEPGKRWHVLKVLYEEALVLFERGEFAAAKEALDSILAEFPDDEPSRRLAQRNATCVQQPPAHFDSVWNLESK
jgi:adenylate cyclase